ncbi:hypothetical protein [uncultured Bosea sp.]|uniref:hypothetical protein n=1 Tax=uncultured Bosea sp. TaxID=211457 RepID=UPI0025EB918B|nr:hypothetical protein [uncultured Bosea sp.]
MIFSRVMAYACLTALAGIFAVVVALMILLTIVQLLRGEAIPDPAARAIGAVVAAGLALVCRAVAKRLI